jgi:hypothetical protein
MRSRGKLYRVAVFLLFAIVTVSLAAAELPSLPKVATNDMSDHARKQIEALLKEKASRSHGRKKMDSQLVYGIKNKKNEKIADDVDFDDFEIYLPLDANGDAILDISATITPQFLGKLRALGAQVLIAHSRYDSVRVSVDLEAVDAIADLAEVRYIQPMQDATTSRVTPPDSERLRTTRGEHPERDAALSQSLIQAMEQFELGAYNVGTAGVRKSEADVTHRAALARNTYGTNGSGVKIGVLSDGVRNLAAAQASGDIGPVTVLAGQSGLSAGQCAATASCDEGTAMLEIVHDIAPGAQLYFATAFGGSANFANNIRQLRNAGCDIIVDDVFYFAESPFQDGQAPAIISPTNGGVVAQAVNDVTAAGALYFSSAGNSGNKNDGTSGVWEGDFVDGGAATGPLSGAGRVHTFPGGLTYDVVTLVGSSQYNLNWSDPLGASNNDYDLFALNAAGTALTAASTGDQSGTQDPFEAIAPVAANSRLVIVKFAGAARYLRLTTNRGRLNVNTTGQTTGHSCALNAFGVAATPVSGAFPNAFNAANVVETFSSDGPRRLFFQPDGTPYTPGNVSSTGGSLRQKPDITAADGVSVTGAGGFGISFFGTSAAAPHAAAIAALLKSANPSLTAANIRNALQSTAIDIETAGIDRDAGYGIVMPDAALQFIGAAPLAAEVSLGTVTVAEVGGNANSFIEPAERGTVSVPLLNTGNTVAGSVTATLTSSTPGVIITAPAQRSYPNIAATNGTSTSTPFELVYGPTAVYAANIDFVLTVSYNGSTRAIPFYVPTGQLVNISTVLDTVAPVVPVGSPYTGVTGLQTSRMNFTFPISACGPAKASPGAAVSALTRRYDAYSFVNTSPSTICVTVNLTHSATALLYVDSYMPVFVPPTVAANWAADNGGSATSGSGTTQLYSFNVAPGQPYVVVVSETNQNGGLNVPYNLRVSGLPATAVPANQAPVNAVPAAQAMLEDGVLTLSGASAISVSDADAGGNTVQVSLSASNGLLSLSGTAGLSFSAGDGSADAAMTFSGSTASINGALNGLTYTPFANFNGAAAISINTNDGGNTGTGGPKSDSDSVSVSVTAVNDAPSFTAGANQTSSEDAGLQTVAWASAISAGPANESSQALTFHVANDANALFATQPAIAADGTLTYAAAANANGTANVSVYLTDDGGTANGGVDSTSTVAFTISISAVNDAPQADAGADQTIECSTPVLLSGAASSDIDGDSLTYLWTEGATTLGTSVTLSVTLPAGVHTITLRVTDPSGAYSEDTVVVTVVDTTNPVITSNGATILIWPPNKKYTTVNVADLVASASDGCDGSVSLASVVIAKVTSDEGVASDNDILIAAGCKSVQLRADSNGNGDGRIYTITFRATDAAGNSSTLARKVSVAHDQGTNGNGAPAIDSGVKYTVNGTCP